MELQGKTVLVTGASSGIGKAIAIAFAEKRAHVLVHYGKNKAGAQATLDEVKKLSTAACTKQISWIAIKSPCSLRTSRKQSRQSMSW